jgi:hypothetical protein
MVFWSESVNVGSVERPEMMRLCWLMAVCLALAGCGWDAPAPDPPAGSYRVESFAVQIDGETESFKGAAVSDAFFADGRIRPVLGRAFIRGESESHRALILSYALWERRFHADPAVIGKTLHVNGQKATIVGVMPKGFAFPAGTELWVAK